MLCFGLPAALASSDSSELVFTVNGTFDPTLHLTMADVLVDSSTNPQSFRVFIKCSKTDPFRKGCSWVVVPSFYVQWFP